MTEAVPARTPLYALHRELGGKMVAFANYEMPVHYPGGIIAEHLQTRTSAALFDVSHMGQIHLKGPDAAVALEALVPGDITGLAPGRTRYSLFTNDDGGILDDLMVTNAGDHLHVVVNAGCKVADIDHLTRRLGGSIAVVPRPESALLALQGPRAAEVLARLAPEVQTLRFMSASRTVLAGVSCFVSRSGYTGEDGFEISVPAEAASLLAQRLLDMDEVKPAGLGARDSLRLEAGLCLYGHDIDTTTTPVEADLAWAIPKRRRDGGGYPGASVIARQLADGPSRKRVGIRLDDRAPAREGTVIVDGTGAEVGRITSGGFGPSVDAPIAMGYVAVAHAKLGAAVGLVVRGIARPARIVPLPFVPHRYHRS